MIEIFQKAIDLRIVPCGLGARDSLRLEKGYSLYGNEIDDSITPMESGLMWTVALDKDFIGRDALLSLIREGCERKLVGFQMQHRSSIARRNSDVFAKPRNANSPIDVVIGKVTSGIYSPVFKK